MEKRHGHPSVHEELTGRVNRLKETKATLEKMYRRGQPNPSKMKADQFAREWELLNELVGTTFMTKKLFKRWSEINREHGTRVIAGVCGPY